MDGGYIESTGIALAANDQRDAITALKRMMKQKAKSRDAFTDEQIEAVRSFYAAYDEQSTTIQSAIDDLCARMSALSKRCREIAEIL